jgi:deoxyribose-phosphate aldolase
MARRLAELAKTIDHTLLDPSPTPEELGRVCDEAREHHFASVCVLPAVVGPAAERLRGCDVKVAGVVGFPLGADTARDKLAAAERCVAAGAHELDVVLNVDALLRGEILSVRDELETIVRGLRMRSVNGGRGGALVKVVLECGRLGSKLAQLACTIVEMVGADFVVTSTGEAPASVYDVELLRERLPERVGVKAGGSIPTAEAAAELVAAGAGRLGPLHAVALVNGNGAPA